MFIQPTTSPLACPHCGTEFPHAEPDFRAIDNCVKCRRPTRVLVFPAFHRPATQGPLAEVVLLEGEAACYYHSQKRAHVPCDACGRFLCAMCDLQLNNQHLCPQCLETGARKGKVQSIERERTRWDQITATLLILPLVFCWILLPVTSLTALGIVVWKWKSPGSLVTNTRLVFGVCSVFALLELAGSVVLWWLMISGGL